jgi:cellobiose-specific phosphotransferase system component IIA
MPATAKAVPPPPRSPGRQRLHDAIQRYVAAVAQHERINQALGKLDGDIYGVLERNVRRAREALDEAHAVAPEMLVASALGEPADPAAPTVAKAEAALKDADRALLDARQARSTLRDELRDRENTVDQAKRAVDAAARSVVSQDPTTRAVLNEFNRAGRHLLRLSRVMRTLEIGHTGMSADDLGLSLRIVDIAPPGEPNRSLYRPEPAWLAALAALRDDADTELPGPPPAEEDDADDGAAAAAA